MMIESKTDATTTSQRGLPRRVLVVDDEESIRLLLKEYFEIVGLEVHTAGSGIEGLKALEQETYGLVLCDVSMPGLDGFEVFDRILKLKPDQRFVFISGYAFAGSKRKLLQKSMGLLHKPFHLEDLNRLLAKVYPDL
jgi:two-component system, NtrC family, nitrogen regulation response regulator NtrX